MKLINRILDIGVNFKKIFSKLLVPPVFFVSFLILPIANTAKAQDSCTPPMIWDERTEVCRCPSGMQDDGAGGCVSVLPTDTGGDVSIWSFLSVLDDRIDAFCNPTQTVFNNIARDQPQQSIMRLALNLNATRQLSLVHTGLGMSIDNALRCVTLIPGVGTLLTNTTCTVLTGAPANTTDCDALLGGPLAMSNPREWSKSPVSGSIAGLYHTTNAAKNYVDSPANLAYFVGQEFKNLPYVGRALAQVDTVELGDTYFQKYVAQVYTAWRFCRNLAFSMLALIMLVIGVMMINRTKIGPQTIVTIQYALPKIVLSVILIAFSYPIAATMTNFFYFFGARSGATFRATVRQNDAADTVLGNFWDSEGEFKMWNAILYVLSSVAVFFIPGVGAAFLIAYILCLFVIAIQALIVLIKWFLIYAKLLLEIVFSPIELAIAAIPGNEDRSGESKIIKWFKKFLAYGLSMLALSFMPHLIWYLGLLFLVSGVTHPATRGGDYVVAIPLPAIAGFQIDTILFFTIVIIGYSMTLKMPGQIQYMLMGEKTRSR